MYLDVSGSVESHLPWVLGLLLGLSREVWPVVHQFSNKVVDASLDDLARGILRTTGGTDFDCVVEHALAHRYQRLVVITDGFGALDGGLAELFRATGASLFLVLLDVPAVLPEVNPLGELAREVWHLS